MYFGNRKEVKCYCTGDFHYSVFALDGLGKCSSDINLASLNAKAIDIDRLCKCSRVHVSS